MNPIERALGILLLLTGGKLVPASALADRFQVSLRTVYRDIDRLIALGVPVDSERGAEGGFRLARDYIQPPVALTRNETAALLASMALGRNSRAVPLSTDLASAERKLLASLPKSVHGLLKNSDRLIGVEPLPPDIFHPDTKPAPTCRWQAALDGFMSGILELKRVRFDHVSPGRRSQKSHDVEPHGILFDRDLWYLAGRCVESATMKVYRADRVQNFEVSGLYFRPQKDFTIQNLLGGSWLSQAMRRWKREEECSQIRITAAQAKKLSVDWYYRHATFTPHSDGNIMISIPSIERDRILPLVRWLGLGAELLAPENLRLEFAGDLKSLSTLYDEPVLLERSA